MPELQHRKIDSVQYNILAKIANHLDKVTQVVHNSVISNRV